MLTYYACEQLSTRSQTVEQYSFILKLLHQIEWIQVCYSKNKP